MIKYKIRSGLKVFDFQNPIIFRDERLILT